MMNKSTHEGEKINLHMPIMKRHSGKYIAVLSDTSIDRDDERIDKGCIEKLGQDDGYLACLCNHNNDVFMQVAEWTNRGIETIDGHTALVAEPKFFESNPKAKVIKGMLDEGARIGVSIGAIVKDREEIDGMKVYKELELIEASFVAVPSNRHGRAMRVAKSFNKKKEEIKVEKEFTQKDIDAAIEESVQKMNVDLQKQLKEKDEKITELSKKLEDLQKECDDDKKKAEEEAAAAKKEAEKAKLEADKANKQALEKQQFADEGGEELPKQVDVKKEMMEGKLPVMRG